MNVLSRRHGISPESRSQPEALSGAAAHSSSICFVFLFRVSLITISLGVLFWSAFVTIGRSKSAPPPASSPAPAPSPPVIEFQAIADREVVEPDNEVTIFLIISNKSGKPVKVIDVTGSSDSFVVNPLLVNADLPPFEAQTKRLTIIAGHQPVFTLHKLPLVMRYTWDAGGRPVTSAQSATVSMQLRRRFEEEAKGFPGGTAAFLYLLLPIIPALLSYQFVDRWRRGEGFHLPAFKAEHIVPAFFLAIVLSFVILLVASSGSGINYSDPLVFLTVLTLSLLAGAIVPAVRFLYDRSQMRTWGFRDNDSVDEYVRKALLSPWNPAEFVWVTGRVGKVLWKGILLEQPGGAKALGATLQVSKTEKMTKELWATAQAELFGANDVLLDRERLVKMIKEGQLTLSIIEPIVEGNRSLTTFVAVRQVKGFQQTDSESKNLLRPLT